MTKNKIINEKLHGINHKLNTEKLWDELESKLPPVKKRRRLPLFWLIGCLIGVVVIGLLLWGLDVTNLRNPTADSISKVDFRSSVIKSQTIESNKLASSTLKTDLETETEHSKISKNNNEKTEVDPSYSDAKTNLRRTIKKEPKTNNLKILSKTAADSPVSIYNEVRAPVRELENSSFHNENTLKKPALNLLPLGTSVKEKSGDKQGSVSNTTIAYLPLITSMLRSEENLNASPQYTDVVFPVKTNRKNMELGLGLIYGRSLVQSSVLTNNLSNVNSSSGIESLDIMGLDFNLGVNISKNYGIMIGGEFLRYTNKLNILQENSINSSISDANGYSITESNLNINAFETYDVFDMKLETYYHHQMGRWSLRPSVGLSYNIYNQYNGVDVSQPFLSPSGDANKEGIELVAVPERFDLGIGYRAGLNLGYNINSRLNLTAGIVYQSAKSVGDNSTLNASIWTKAGLQYRF